MISGGDVIGKMTLSESFAEHEMNAKVTFELSSREHSVLFYYRYVLSRANPAAVAVASV